MRTLRWSLLSKLPNQMTYPVKLFVYICVYLCIFVYICVYLCIFVYIVNEYKPVCDREFGAGFACALQKFRHIPARWLTRRGVYFGAYNTYTPAASVMGNRALEYHPDCRRTRRLPASACTSTPRPSLTELGAMRVAGSANERQGGRRRLAWLWKRWLHLARSRAPAAAFLGSMMLIWTEP
jgi:hypothetical protein